MALDDLIARLERDAEARLVALRASTDAEVSRLNAEAAAVSKDHRVATLETRRRLRRARLERELVEARQDGRAAVLERQHALITRVLERARRLGDETAASWRDALPRLLDGALSYLEGQRAVVHCRPDLRATVEAHLAVREDAVVLEDVAVEPGCLVTSADGSITIELTLSALLRRHERAVATAVLAGVPP